MNFLEWQPGHGSIGSKIKHYHNHHEPVQIFYKSIAFEGDRLAYKKYCTLTLKSQQARLLKGLGYPVALDSQGLSGSKRQYHCLFLQFMPMTILNFANKC